MIAVSCNNGKLCKSRLKPIGTIEKKSHNKSIAVEATSYTTGAYSRMGGCDKNITLDRLIKEGAV